MLFALHVFFDRRLVVLPTRWGLPLAVLYPLCVYFSGTPRAFGAPPPANHSFWTRYMRVCRERVARSNDFADFGGKGGFGRDGQHPRPAVSQ